MNKYACVADNGVVLYTMSIDNDADKPGSVTGCSFISVPVEMPDQELIASYYDFGAEAFVALPPKPSDDYDFDLTTKQWVFNTERASAAAIEKRNMLLYSCDWTQLPDVTIVNRQEWAVYRQALRDITTQQGYPIDIIWPIAPGA